MAGDLLLRLRDALAWRARRPLMAPLRALLGAEPGERVLDLGGGTGRVGAAAAPGAAVVVLEPDPAKARLARRRGHGAAWVRGAAEVLPFRDGSFDRALAVVSFHHVADQAKALREVRRALRPGGAAVFQELDPAERVGGFVAWFEHRVRHDEVRFLRPEELCAMLGRAGFADARAAPAARGYLVAARRP